MNRHGVELRARTARANDILLCHGPSLSASELLIGCATSRCTIDESVSDTVTAYMADLYRPGANEVALYEVERTRGRAVFHPLAD